MRGDLVTLLAAFLLVAAPAQARDFSQAYAKSGDASAAAGRWGEAMAAYDAAHNEAPADASISTRRRDAAAKWIELMAPQLADVSPPDKALALLFALAEEGKKRGADDAVQRHVVAALDAAVLKRWTGEETSADPKALWQSIRLGEELTGPLPEGSLARKRLGALTKRAVASYEQLASAAKHPGSAYLYSAMAARLNGGTAPADRLRAWQDVTQLDYKLNLAQPKNCPELEPAFREKLRQMNNYFSSSGRGLPAQVDVTFNCVALAPPQQREERRTWVEKNLEFSSAKSCSPQTVLVQAASHTETTVARSSYGRTVRVVDVPSTYNTVENCSTTFSSREVSETKTDLLTITSEELGYDARGSGAILVAGTAFVMPLGARLVTERITTAGRIFGVKEGFTWFEPKMFAGLTAHTLWLELVYLTEKAHEGLAAELVTHAASADADTSVGEMTNAVRLHHRVTKDYARWFEERIGLDEQQLNELVLDAPRVKPALRVAGTYKLDVPKVDPNLVKSIAKQRKPGGDDDFR